MTPSNRSPRLILASPAGYALAFVAAFVLFTAVSLAFRFGGTPPESVAKDPAVQTLGGKLSWQYTKYNAIVRRYARSIGDFRPVYAAAVAWRNDRHSHVYNPTELAEGRASFVYTPFAAMLVYPLALLDLPLERAALYVHTANRACWLVGGLLLYLILMHERKKTPLSMALFGLAYLAFYPLAEALHLTQAQVWIWFALVAAAYLLHAGFILPSGVALGLAICIKPHLVMIPLLLLAAPGFPRLLILMCLGTAAGIALLCLLWVGPVNLFEYVTNLLPALSAGYAYHPNQSINGLLLRLGHYAPAEQFNLAPAVGWVKLASAVFALAVLAVTAFVLRRRGSGSDPMVSLAIAVTAGTVASPVTWPHHLSALSIGLAVLARTALDGESFVSPKVQWLGFLSFFLIGTYIDGSRLDGFPLALLSGFGFYGSLLLLACLMTVSHDEVWQRRG